MVDKEEMVLMVLDQVVEQEHLVKPQEIMIME
jgi:hypothetical protein